MHQFYPTPSTLAFKAYSLFKNKKIIRMLEPSAGRGDLLAAITSNDHRSEEIDCIELDLNNQAVLRGKGLRVIDADFMAFSGVAMYSHILMNPPFAEGAEHVVKGWSLLASGELVAIVNAETVKNPFSSVRKFLFKLIQDHGSVEYVEQAFTDPDTLHKTTVEVALIRLEKIVDLKQGFTQGLEQNKQSNVNFDTKQELAIKDSSISNIVIVHNAANKALLAAEIAIEESIHYTAMLDKPINEMIDDKAVAPGNLQQRYNKGCDNIRRRAWSTILKSTEFSKFLSSKEYNKLVANFQDVSNLSFTESNIRGFLIGLINGQGDMNMQMILDCFDDITKYVPDNRAYYRGWKSNLKHKEQAYRVQMTRFIMPRASSYYSGNISHETIKQLADWDKVFAMLDGKVECDVSLERLFSNSEAVKRLENGERLSASYFDVRYYPGVKTIHFFPTNKKLIDRFNRMVGKERQWLPQDSEKASEAFWKQFNDAEKITKKIVKPKGYHYNDGKDELLMAAHLKACDDLGYDTSYLLGYEEKEAA